MFVDLRLDQLLKSDVVRKRRLRAVESNDLLEIGCRCGTCGLSIHIEIKQVWSLPEPTRLIDEYLPQEFLMDLGGPFDDLHDLGITVKPGNRG